MGCCPQPDAGGTHGQLAAGRPAPGDRAVRPESGAPGPRVHHHAAPTVGRPAQPPLRIRALIRSPGARAAAWFGAHAAQLTPPLTAAQVARVQYLLRWHVPSDYTCPALTPELQALKD